MKSLLVLLGLLGLGQCGIFTRSKCVEVPSNLCAVVYDDEKCNGWALNINEGEVGYICMFCQKNLFHIYTTFQIMFKWWDPVYYWYRNDIEAVSVRKGCTFTGFDDSSLNGGSFTIRSSSSKDT